MHDTFRSVPGPRFWAAQPLKGVLLALIFIGTGGCGSPTTTARGSRAQPIRATTNAQGGASTKLWGYVHNKDRTRATNARVYTEPLSGTTVTDSTGYWEISRGLVPGNYVVFANRDGIVGKTSNRVPAKLGTPNEKPIYVILGEETVWPPPLGLDTILRKATVGPPGGRGT